MTTDDELERARIALYLARLAAELLDEPRRGLSAVAGDVEEASERLYRLADREGFQEAPGAPEDDPIWGPS